MQEENREGISGALKTLAAVVIVFLLLAALFVALLLLGQLKRKVTLRAAARWGIWWQTASVFRQAQRWLRSTAMQRRPPCASS